jgi:DNA-binding MarR family transcriptional regulator
MRMRERKSNPHCKSVYRYLKAYSALHSYPPSQREIAADCHLSKTTVLRCLDRLELDGLIVREPGQARSITIMDDD